MPFNNDHDWLSRKWNFFKTRSLSLSIAPENPRKISACTKNLALARLVIYRKRAHKNNCLTTTHPNLSKEWHPTKNEALSPDNITAGSHKRLWWRCKRNSQHEWQATCANRATKHSGCPFCSGRRASDLNSLTALYPEILKEWHPTKNGWLSPDQITPGSARKIWWICRNDAAHEWQTNCNNRTSINKTGCPVCANTVRVIKRISLKIHE